VTPEQWHIKGDPPPSKANMAARNPGMRILRDRALAQQEEDLRHNIRWQAAYWELKVVFWIRRRFRWRVKDNERRGRRYRRHRMERRQWNLDHRIGSQGLREHLRCEELRGKIWLLALEALKRDLSFESLPQIYNLKASPR
jgi:hypothetical protein